MRLLATPLVIVALLAGFWLFASPLAHAFADLTGAREYWSSIAGGALWFVVAAIALGKLRKERPALRLPVLAGFLLAVAFVGGVFAWTTFTDDRVDDDVSFAADALPAAGGASAEGPPRPLLVAQGEFTGIDHSARGTARIVALGAGDRRLVFTEFDVERAPDLRVYMAVDRVDGDVGDYVELDRLKGNVGDQYYRLPKSLDLGRYGHVVIWCKAFDTGVAQAPLDGRT